MPYVVSAIDKQVPITNYSSIPNPFSGVSYLVWILDPNKKGTSCTWTSVNQNPMAGEV
jgi:hypothetical protein